MFTLTKFLANYDYNKGRRDEQKAVENLLEFLRMKKLLDPATVNFLAAELNTIDRRPKLDIE